MNATRADAIATATALWDDGSFLADLARRVAIPSESQEPERKPDLARYLTEEIAPACAALGLEPAIFENTDPTGGPFLVATRIEDPSLPTVLLYGHGDVVRGLADQWRPGLDPWTITVEGERIYGRGTVDNKGQHSIALAALGAVLRARGGRLGFNVKYFVEMGEEIGSIGLYPFLESQRERMAADVFIGLDGPRYSMKRPDVKLGCRGGVAFDLIVKLREGSHHSGHWGGVIKDPGFVLGHALSRIVSPDGRILVPGWTPEHIPNSVRVACAGLEIDQLPNMPEADPGWGEPGLSATEKALAWTSVIVLAYKTGTPERPVNAVQGEARARLQVRHTVDVPAERIVPALRDHLAREGCADVQIEELTERDRFPASRTDPDDPWARFVVASVAETAGIAPNVVPNSGGSNPSRMFQEVLGTPTIWIPSSYSGCGQHGPNEHGLAPLFREGLGLMAGLFWDIGEGGAPARRG